MLQKYKFKLLEHFIKTIWAHCLCKKELQPKFLQTERAYSDKNKTEVKQLKKIFYDLTIILDFFRTFTCNSRKRFISLRSRIWESSSKLLKKESKKTHQLVKRHFRISVKN